MLPPFSSNTFAQDTHTRHNLSYMIVPCSLTPCISPCNGKNTNLRTRPPIHSQTYARTHTITTHTLWFELQWGYSMHLQASHTRTHARMHARTHTHTHACTHTHAHMQTHNTVIIKKLWIRQSHLIPSKRRAAMTITAMPWIQDYIHTQTHISYRGKNCARLSLQYLRLGQIYETFTLLNFFS